MEHIVSGCKDCPMYNSDSEYGDRCNHPDNFEYCEPLEHKIGKNIPDDVYTSGEEFMRTRTNWKKLSPDWCPLNKEPITIIKKQ